MKTATASKTLADRVRGALIEAGFSRATDEAPGFTISPIGTGTVKVGAPSKEELESYHGALRRTFKVRPRTHLGSLPHLLVTPVYPEARGE
jgi:hypothetical protein